ncbi:hypothetical protein AAVH_30363 [Aphelenchoides avenae]|nr:hypothetical protein AAVH_30363 [Aphelenchus avenae]
MVDFLRLVWNCSPASLKLRHFQEWMRLYYDTFSAECHRLGVKCPYKWDVFLRMYQYQCPSELLVHFMIITSYLEKITDEKLRTALLSRIVSSFEMVRRDLGWGFDY